MPLVGGTHFWTCECDTIYVIHLPLPDDDSKQQRTRARDYAALLSEHQNHRVVFIDGTEFDAHENVIQYADVDSHLHVCPECGVHHTLPVALRL